MRHPTAAFWIAFVALVLALSFPVVAVFRDVPPGSAPTHQAVFASAWIATAFWYVAVLLLLANRADHHPGTAARACWTSGSGFAVLHTAVALHAAHGWSHEAAYRHTAAVGGFGWGVYVNYLFVLVWTADAAAMWVTPRLYRQRSRYLTWAVHGFLAFVVFNATVVFGRFPWSVMAGGLFTVLGLLWWRAHAVRR